MKLDKMVLANTFGITTAILWIICTLFLVVFPDLSLEITRWWMHGLNVAAMGSWDLTVNNFLLGGITLSISAWGSGYIFGLVWQAVSKK